MACNYGRNENVLSDVILYLQTVLVAESLSDRAEMLRQQLLEKLSNKEHNVPSARNSYMDMNGRSKGLLITKSNSFACLHQQAAYEELCGAHLQPIYNNVPYEDEDDDYGGDNEDDVMCGYEPFAAAHFAGGRGAGPPRTFARSPPHKRHSAPDSGSSSTGSLHRAATNGGGGGGGGGGSLGGRSNSDSSEGSSKSEVISVSANAVRYSASKYGALTKRERILFVDHARKYWAAVLASTLYVYGGEKEPKPCLVVHLDGYAARDANGGGRNKEWAFEVVCPGKKSYQFIAQNQKDMHSWIEAINNSCSKPATPEIVHSASPILCFKQELMPNRELPVPPTCDAPAQDYCYDKPNPIVRPVNVYDSPTDEVDADESIYHFIDESKRDGDVPPKNDDKQFWDGDTSYYNVPNSVPVPVEPTKEDPNKNNGYNGYFTTEKETSYDIITNGGLLEMAEDSVLGVQQIIQKIEEINSKKSSPLLRRKCQPKINNNINCSLIRNSTPPDVYCSADVFYEPMKPVTQQTVPNNVSVCCSQSFRKSR